ncbi:Spo16p TDEL_0G01180 [Torulaspora delbrueckii]|uniref:Uncharacterized protein n=1 Tax=Torulaspora delbrueckii TaxID=4950 RepID=G8ZYL0_TORDE|nr:hypothetical protein TDEL_0G01180 [Torulaspora delbrueckii]CCE93485.1 hypothetical protein TDEL_0G01180 [Torulaspora delbrueckii]
MQVVRETLLRNPKLVKNIRSIIILDVSSDEFLQHLQDAADVNEQLMSALKELLMTLKVKYAGSKDAVLNLNISQLKYPLYHWEEALYLATEEVDFPQEIYITMQGETNRNKYSEDNRMLLKFIKTLEIGKRQAMESILEEDYELLLKKTIMTIIHQYDITEDQLELLLAETHNLAQFLGHCEEHST